MRYVHSRGDGRKTLSALKTTVGGVDLACRKYPYAVLVIHGESLRAASAFNAWRRGMFRVNTSGDMGKGNEAVRMPQSEDVGAKVAEGETAVILVEQIRSQEQVRKRFDEDEIGELADSLDRLGQQQAITVYYDEVKNCFVTIHGERRVRAAKRLGWKKIRAWIRAMAPSEDERIELQLAENIVRSDLNEIEIGEAVAQLKELRGYSTRELANRVGKSQTSVIRLLAILALPEELKQRVADGSLPGSVAYEIGRLPGLSEQRQAARRYLRGEWTRADVERSSRGQSGRISTATVKKESCKGSNRHNPWPVKFDGGNGLRVSVKPSATSDEDAWTFEHVKEALEEALAEVSAWVEGRVKLI